MTCINFILNFKHNSTRLLFGSGSEEVSLFSELFDEPLQFPFGICLQNELTTLKADVLYHKIPAHLGCHLSLRSAFEHQKIFQVGLDI